jgi:hypothetical protein
MLQEGQTNRLWFLSELIVAGIKKKEEVYVVAYN